MCEQGYISRQIATLSQVHLDLRSSPSEAPPSLNPQTFIIP